MTETANSGDISIADKVIARFGGMRKMEAATPFTYSQINSFRRTGNIPEKDRLTVLRAAKAANIELSAWIYIEHLVDIR